MQHAMHLQFDSNDIFKIDKSIWHDPIWDFVKQYIDAFEMVKYFLQGLSCTLQIQTSYHILVLTRR